MPDRVTLSRRAGWRMPPNTVKVDRTTKWGNPHDWRDWLDAARHESSVLTYAFDRKHWCREQAVQAFKEDVQDGIISLPFEELRGKNLACWCHRHEWCHADVLLELANA
jgi:hypothetical protein